MKTMTRFLTCLVAFAASFLALNAYGTQVFRTEQITGIDGGPISFPNGYTTQASQTLLSGTASLTLVAGTNIASVTTPVTMNYWQVGNQVCAQGQVSVTPTAGTTASTFTLSLPVTRASNFTGTVGASGYAGSTNPTIGSCNSTNSAKTVTCNYKSLGTSAETPNVQFCYSVSGN